MQGEAPLLGNLLQILQHALADAGNFQQSLGLADEFGDLLGQVFNRLCRVAVRTDAERVLVIDLQQVGSLVQETSDSFVVHEALEEL